MSSPISFSSLPHEWSRDQASIIGPVSFDFRARLGSLESLSARFVLTPNSPWQIESQFVPFPVSTTSDFVLDRIRCKGLGLSNLQHSSRQLPAPVAVSKTSATRLHLQCPFANCPKKFERASDLQRHGESFHITHPCFVRGCSRNQRGFCRKDKLSEHLRKAHPNFFVPQGQLEQLPTNHQLYDRPECPTNTKKPHTLRRTLLDSTGNNGKKSSIDEPVPTKSTLKPECLIPECPGTKALLCEVVKVESSTDDRARGCGRREQRNLEELQSQTADAKNIGSDQRPRSRESNEDAERESAAKLTDNSMKENPVLSKTNNIPISHMTESDEYSEMDSETETPSDESDFYDYLLDNPEQFLADGLNFPIPESSRQELVERVMDEFWMILNHEWPPCANQCAGSSPSSPSDVRRQSTPMAPSSNEQTHWKRKKGEDDNEKSERQDGDDQGDTPSKKKLKNNSSRRNFRFACPFRKHNPTKYNVVDYRICALNPWENVARLKEHLYRKHMAVPYCGRCWQAFENLDQLSAHVNLPRADVCEATEGRPPEGITPEQERSLRRKRKSYPNQSEESRWRNIYRTLFPGDSVPLPYFDPPREQIATTPNSHSLDEYEAHMREQLPELVRSRVERHLDASVLRGLDFGGIIRECQEELSRTYREAASEGSASQMLSSEPQQPEESTTILDGIFERSESLPRHNSEFVCEVLQIPPPQADSQVLGPSLEATIRDSKPQRTMDQASDSGYASMNVCTCNGHCSCQSNSTNSQKTTTEISNSDPRETFAGHFDTALSLQATSREARNSSLDNSSHIQDHYSQPLLSFQPHSVVFDHSMQSQEQALRNRSGLSDSAPTQPGGGDTFFNPRANYQYQPELSAAPLFHRTGFSFAPTPMQYSNDSMFATSIQEDGLGRDVSWQDAIEWGLFDGPTAPNGF